MAPSMQVILAAVLGITSAVTNVAGSSICPDVLYRGTLDCSKDVRCNKPPTSQGDQCHANGCDECTPGSWKLSYEHWCVDCTIDGCIVCQDYQGCATCKDGRKRVYSEECGYHVCTDAPAERTCTYNVSKYGQCGGRNYYGDTCCSSGLQCVNGEGAACDNAVDWYCSCKDPPPCDSSDHDGDGVSVCQGDCDDNDPTVYPGSVEICDGKDNDCDGEVPADEKTDTDQDGVALCGDCNDRDATVYPGAPEICDGKDNNCDGDIPANEADEDKDGYRICVDCDDNDTTVHPGAEELCDGKDNDCGGTIGPFEIDSDGDGYLACADCDDADFTRNTVCSVVAVLATVPDDSDPCSGYVMTPTDPSCPDVVHRGDLNCACDDNCNKPPTSKWNQCHANGCDECKPGTWKLDYEHWCVDCTIAGCISCQDYLGCASCRPGWKRVINEACGYYICEGADRVKICDNTVQKYKQCGGVNYNGDTCCANGRQCVANSRPCDQSTDYYCSCRE